MKRRSVLWSLGALMASACSTQLEPHRTSRTTDAASITQSESPLRAIRGADLFTGRGQLRRNATIVFDGGRIAEVHDAPTSSGPGIIEASGLTAIPGLIDAHVHWRRWAAPLFVRSGVTTVRDVGTAARDILSERAAQQRGDFIGPRIFAHGPLLDGTRPVFANAPDFDVALDSVEAAEAMAEDLLAHGLDGLKTYANLPGDLIAATASVARAHGLPVASHLGVASASDAARAGVRSIEHASGVNPNASAREQTELLAQLIAQGTWVVPTHVVLSNFARLPTIGTSDYPGLDLVPAETRESWLNWRNNPTTLQTSAAIQGELAAREDFVRAFIAAGGRVGVGSDTPNPFVIPGVSLHDELRHLVSLGLQPADALEAATSAAAQLLGRSDLGTIARGAAADVVLVKGDPTSNISAIKNVQVVIQAGKVIYRA